MLLEVESNVDPERLDSVQGLFHFSLLLGLVADFLNVFANLTQLQVIDVA